MLSMTGFGNGEADSGGISVEVELSSVNRKQFDLRVNLPRSLAALEPEVVKLTRRYLNRGSINCKITVAVSGRARQVGVRVDMPAARALVESLRKTGQALQLRDDLSIGMLMKVPNLVVFDDASDNSGKVRPVLKKALKQALESLVQMRAAEGKSLAADLAKRFARLEKMVTRIEKLAPSVVPRYRKSLIERLRQADLPVDLDEERLAKEIALFADRCDISEEVVRLRSHFRQVAKLMDSSEPVGRAFDFLCQEFLREINTIGSKANDARLSRLVIDFKTELESVREQVQNIE